MVIVFYGLLFVFGLAAGSFLNVVSLRYLPGKSVFRGANISGRSRCLYCKKKLKWFELVPIFSFFLQKGKCRHCHGKLTLQYPLVEIAGGAIFAAVPYALQRFFEVSLFSLSVLTPAVYAFVAFTALWIFLLLILLLITIIDVRHFIIPDELNGMVGIAGIVLIFLKIISAGVIIPFHNSFLKNYEIIFSPFSAVWANHILGAVVGGAFFALLFYAGKGRAMGFGDVKLSFVLGLALGWPDIGLSVIFSFIFGGVWGAALLLKKKKTLKDRLPFGPFLAFGAATTVFFGFQIVKGYFGLFNI